MFAPWRDRLGQSGGGCEPVSTYPAAGDGSLDKQEDHFTRRVIPITDVQYDSRRELKREETGVDLVWLG